MSCKHIARLALPALGMLAATAVRGAVFEWTGPDNGAWSDNANWSLASGTDEDGVPDIDDDVTLGAGASGKRIDATAANVAAHSLTFTAEAASSVLIDATDRTFDLGDGLIVTVEAGSGAHTVKAGTLCIYGGGWGAKAFFSNNCANPLVLDAMLTHRMYKKPVFAGSGTVVLTRTMEIEDLLTVDGILDARGVTLGSGEHLDGLAGDGLLTNSTATATVLRVRGDSTFGGALGGNIGFVRGRRNLNDFATTIFSGACTHSGTTTVHGGRLRIDGTHTGGGDYLIRGKVDAGKHDYAGIPGILAGSGTIALAEDGSIALQGFDLGTLPEYPAYAENYPYPLPYSYARLEPGQAGIGTLTIAAGTLSLGTLSRYDAEVGAAGGSDRVALTGDLSLDGTGSGLALKTLPGAFDGSAYTILIHSGERTGKFAVVTLDDGSGVAADITATAERSFAAGDNGRLYRLVYGADAIRIEPVQRGSVITVR